MRTVSAISLATLMTAVAATAAFARGDDQAPKSLLNCTVGPVTKTYGDNPWLVYSCNDDHSLAMVADPQSPAHPFYFLIKWTGTAHQIDGEGTGKKSVTDAAFADVKKLSETDFTTLIAETKKQ